MEATRQQMFRHYYAIHYEYLHKMLFKSGPMAQVGGWAGTATRTKVRDLARRMARESYRNRYIST